MLFLLKTTLLVVELVVVVPVTMVMVLMVLMVRRIEMHDGGFRVRFVSGGGFWWNLLMVMEVMINWYNVKNLKM